jgi:hypothetical protein
MTGGQAKALQPGDGRSFVLGTRTHEAGPAAALDALARQYGVEPAIG